MRIRGVCVDLDGTLVNTTQANFAAYRRAIAQVLPSQDIPEGRLYSLIDDGVSSSHFLPTLFPSISVDQIQEIRTAKAKFYPSFVDLTSVNEPLITFLQTLCRDKPLALVTTAQPNNLQAVLTYHRQLRQLFSTIISGADVRHLKPAPDAYLLALTRLSLPASDVLAFEDSVTGMESARNAGIPVFPVPKVK
jgi:HAD superfamily hydrolase (TIGR01509 family)